MPKGGKSSLVPVSAGVNEDLNTFLRGFLEIRSCKYADFKQLFKRMEMITIFNGRSYYAEIIEFNELLLCSCLKYLEPFAGKNVARCLEERLFGLYSLYTFFYLQQTDHVVKIRMDPDIHREFVQFLELLRSGGYLDAWACGLRLQQDKAIKIVAFVEIFDPTFHKKFENEDNWNDIPIAVNIDAPTANLRNMLRSDEFLKLELCQKRYQEMKTEMNIEEDLVDNDLMKNLEDIVQKMETKHYTEWRKKDVTLKISTDHTAEQLASRGMQRSAIKHAAYSADLHYARTRRHRNGDAQVEITTQFEFNNNNELAENMEKKPELEELEEQKSEKQVQEEVVVVKTRGRKKKNRIKKKYEKEPTGKSKKVKNSKQIKKVQQRKGKKAEKVPKTEVKEEIKEEIKEEVKATGRQTRNSLSSEFFPMPIAQVDTRKPKRSVNFLETVNVRMIPTRQKEEEEEEAGSVEIKSEESSSSTSATSEEANVSDSGDNLPSVDIEIIAVIKTENEEEKSIPEPYRNYLDEWRID